RPFVVDHRALRDNDLDVAAVRVHGEQLAGPDEADALAVGREGDAHLRVRRVGQLLDLELVRLDQFGVFRVVRLEQVEVFVAAAVGDKNDLLRVGRPGDAVVVGCPFREPPGLAAAGGHQEQLTVDGEGDVLFIVRQGKLGGAAGEGDSALDVGLVVGVRLDRQLARAAAARRDDPQVGAAFVDDPLPVPADAGTADTVVLV